MALIRTLGELADAGGPETLARKAAQETTLRERRLWLDTLEDIPEAQRPDIAHWWIRDLRRKLGLRQPKDVIRAQTRARVAAYRARRLFPRYCAPPRSDWSHYGTESDQ
jgi:hypothetical protein